MKFPEAGSTDQIGVPGGNAVPVKTFTVMEAFKPLKLAVSVAVPGAIPVSCGGSPLEILRTVGSLITHVAPATCCPRSPTNFTVRFCPTNMLAIVGVMKIAFGGTALKLTET